MILLLMQRLKELEVRNNPTWKALKNIFVSPASAGMIPTLDSILLFIVCEPCICGGDLEKHLACSAKCRESRICGDYFLSDVSRVLCKSIQ